MKKITKVLIGGLLASLLIFTGCMAANDSVGKLRIEYDSNSNGDTGAEVTASINYTNDTNEIMRGVRLFNNQKKDIALNIVMDNASDKTGLMGIIFNRQENDDGTYNFIMLGYKSESGKPDLCITAYKNISDETDWELPNFGAGNPMTNDAFLAASGKASYDIIESNSQQNGSRGWKTLDISRDENNKLKVGVVLIAEKANEDEENVNAYKVYIYKDKTNDELNDIADALAKDDAARSDEEKTLIASNASNKVWNEVIPNAEIDREDTNRPEGQMGFYANAYANKTLKGEWQVADISHNPNGIFWADEEVVSKAAKSNSNTLNIQLVK